MLQYHDYNRVLLEYSTSSSTTSSSTTTITVARGMVLRKIKLAECHHVRPGTTGSCYWYLFYLFLVVLFVALLTD